MDIIEEKIKKFKIELIGSLQRNETLTFDINANHANKKGFVYLWVAEKENFEKKIVYVGMTKRELAEKNGRLLKEHQSGFRNTKSGIKNALMISKIPIEYTIAIYCRHAETKLYFDIEEVSLCATDEQFFLNEFKRYNQPLMNGIRDVNKYNFQ